MPYMEGTKFEYGKEIGTLVMLTQYQNDMRLIHGNELSGHGIGASVNVELYAKDVINVREMINDMYENSCSKPSLVAPGGFFFTRVVYAKLLQVSGSNVVNVITHHIYNLGAGVDPLLPNRILDPHYLSRVSETFNSLHRTIEDHG